MAHDRGYSCAAFFPGEDIVFERRLKVNTIESLRLETVVAGIRP